MKVRLIVIGVVIVLLAGGITVHHVVKYNIPGWRQSVVEVKKEYPVVRKIVPSSGVPIAIHVVVYLKAPINQQEAGDITDCMRVKLFTDELLQGLNGYYNRAGWNGEFSELDVNFMYKNHQIYRFVWDLGSNIWGGYDTPVPMTPVTPVTPSAGASPAA